MSNISTLIKVCKIKNLPQEVEDLIFLYLNYQSDFKKIFLITPYGFNPKNTHGIYFSKTSLPLRSAHEIHPIFLINILNEMKIKGLKPFTNKGVINILYKVIIDEKNYFQLKECKTLRNLFYDNKTIEYLN